MSKHVYVIWTNVAELPGEVEGRYFPRVYRTKTAAVASINADEIDGCFSPDCREDRATFTRNHKDDGSIELFVREPNKNLWKSRKFWVKKIGCDQDCVNFLPGQDFCDDVNFKEKLVVYHANSCKTGIDWVETVKEGHPEIIARCDWWKLDGDQWADLICFGSQDAIEHCDWEKLSAGNWQQVLKSRPALGKFCAKRS